MTLLPNRFSECAFNRPSVGVYSSPYRNKFNPCNITPFSNCCSFSVKRKRGIIYFISHILCARNLSEVLYSIISPYAVDVVNFNRKVSVVVQPYKSVNEVLFAFMRSCVIPCITQIPNLFTRLMLVLLNCSYELSSRAVSCKRLKLCLGYTNLSHVDSPLINLVRGGLLVTGRTRIIARGVML